MNKRKIALWGLAALGLVVVVTATQLSVLRLGTNSFGSTVLVWRTGDLSELRLFDSSRDVCERKPSRLFGSTRLCEAALALKILRDDRALLRWNVTPR